MLRVSPVFKLKKKVLSIQTSVQEDFRELRDVVEKNGWMKPSPTFFTLHLLHVIAMEAASVAVLWYFGTSWLSVLAAMALFVSAQVKIVNT